MGRGGGDLRATGVETRLGGGVDDGVEEGRWIGIARLRKKEGTKAGASEESEDPLEGEET